MKIYGFERMYDNGKCNVDEKVTKSEAIKMVVSATLNISNIDKIVYMENKEYENQEWVKYAVDNEIISDNDINKTNYNKKATIMDCLKYLYMAKTKLLDMQVDIEANPNFLDFGKYTNEEQLVIKDMIWNKIIENNSVKLNAYKNIRKGKLNELIILFSEKYNTITENDAKLNINEEKLPTNYLDYPYCLANVNKNIYETRFIYSDVSKFKKPVEVYAEKKENFYSLNIRIQQYMSTILNIDYNFISEEEFKNNLQDIFINNISDNMVKDYIEYVKKNKIILRGNCNIIYPCFYFDGSDYRIRCIVSYNIESAEKRENLIFGDKSEFNLSYNYDKNNEQITLDIPVNTLENGESLYIRFGSINKGIVKNT